MSSDNEMACTYAALILADDDVAVTVSFIHHMHVGIPYFYPLRNFITSISINGGNGFITISQMYSSFNCSLITLQGDKLATILKAANFDIEPFWPNLFARALSGVNIKDLIAKIGSGAGAAPAAAAPAGGAAPAGK